MDRDSILLKSSVVMDRNVCVKLCNRSFLSAFRIIYVMASYKHMKKFLGYGGDGQPAGPAINHERTGLNFPPTHRELLEYAIYLSDSFSGRGSYPEKELIK